MFSVIVLVGLGSVGWGHASAAAQAHSSKVPASHSAVRASKLEAMVGIRVRSRSPDRARLDHSRSGRRPRHRGVYRQCLPLHPSPSKRPEEDGLLPTSGSGLLVERDSLAGRIRLGRGRRAVSVPATRSDDRPSSSVAGETPRSLSFLAGRKGRGLLEIRRRALLGSASFQLFDIFVAFRRRAHRAGPGASRGVLFLLVNFRRAFWFRSRSSTPLRKPG